MDDFERNERSKKGGMNIMEDVLGAVSTVGFPIVVALYLLLRIEPKLSTMTICIEKLTAIVEQDSNNTKELERTLQNFNLGINDLKNEIHSLNVNEMKRVNSGQSK